EKLIYLGRVTQQSHPFAVLGLDIVDRMTKVQQHVNVEAVEGLAEQPCVQCRREKALVRQDHCMAGAVGNFPSQPVDYEPPGSLLFESSLQPQMPAAGLRRVEVQTGGRVQNARAQQDITSGICAVLESRSAGLVHSRMKDDADRFADPHSVPSVSSWNPTSAEPRRIWNG